MRDPEDTEGDFDIFVKDTPYSSTFDLHYEKEEFEKLHDLVKFNTEINKQVCFLVAFGLICINAF